MGQIMYKTFVTTDENDIRTILNLKFVSLFFDRKDKHMVYICWCVDTQYYAVNNIIWDLRSLRFLYY